MLNVEYENVYGAVQEKCTDSSAAECTNILWFDREAASWEEALPVGNGFLGAMVFGKTDTERIQINEDSLWSGGFIERINPDAKENLPTIRRLLRDEHLEEAELLAKRSMYATYPHMRHYQTLGDIWIEFNAQDRRTIVKKMPNVPLNSLTIDHKTSCAHSYTRQLDIASAVGSVSYTKDSIHYSREFFTSYPDKVLMYRFDADAPFNFEVSLTRKENRSGIGASYCDGVEVIDNNTIRLFGVQGGNQGIGFELLVSVDAAGGRVYRMGGHLIVEGTQEATLYCTARTTYRTPDPLAWCIATIKRAREIGYGELKRRHIDDFASYYTAHRLRLEQDGDLSRLTTEQRLGRMRDGEVDVGLVNTYYNYARYLLISSSREGSLPANLQGIWNQDFAPAWGSKYTININIQMNYWIAEKTGLSALHMPLLEHLKTMHPHGVTCARTMYGMRGFCCHHNTDLWGDCAPQDHRLSSTVWPMGGAWLCLHIIEHYRYTRDRKFMTEYYDILRDSVLFFLDYLVKNDDGYWVTSPTSSPENIYTNTRGETGCLCEGTAMDSEILRELFSGFIEVSEDIGRTNDILSEVREKRDALSPLKIGRLGTIQEWTFDYQEADPGHRHMSQLFALHPADQIRFDATPHLAEAAKTTIERRLSHGGGHTGWSKAWIIALYARLREEEKAFRGLCDLVGNFAQNNLLNTHPPFQIDGNFGGAEGLLEMLVQDFGKTVYLLPALPNELSNGLIEGFRLKDGAILDMKWSHHRPTYICLCALRNCNFVLHISGEKKVFVELREGRTSVIDW